MLQSIDTNILYINWDKTQNKTFIYNYSISFNSRNSSKCFSTN